MDADSMTRKEAYRETLRNFRTGNIDILVGTQMIAKGLHFPNVTLVGIINADLALHLPDFRAGERTFQLLTQVAGRAGRGETSGEVFVQTYTPFSPSIQFARHHDFTGYFQQELEFRERCDFPPFKHADPDHRAIRARRSCETFRRNIKATLERSIARRIHPGRRNPCATRKTTRPIPISHFDPRRSHHALEPTCPRNARQAAIPRRRHRHCRRRSLSVAVIFWRRTRLAFWRSRPGDRKLFYVLLLGEQVFSGERNQDMLAENSSPSSTRAHLAKP